MKKMEMSLTYLTEVLVSDSLYQQAIKLYLSLGCSYAQAKVYADNDFDFWFGEGDVYSYHLIRF